MDDGVVICWQAYVRWVAWFIDDRTINDDLMWNAATQRTKPLTKPFEIRFDEFLFQHIVPRLIEKLKECALSVLRFLLLLGCLREKRKEVRFLSFRSLRGRFVLLSGIYKYTQKRWTERDIITIHKFRKSNTSCHDCCLEHERVCVHLRPSWAGFCGWISNLLPKRRTYFSNCNSHSVRVSRSRTKRDAFQTLKISCKSLILNTWHGHHSGNCSKCTKKRRLSSIRVTYMFVLKILRVLFFRLFLADSKISRILRAGGKKRNI